jgi:hypothetical protein
MDVRGQYDCERLFMILMWIATAVSFVAGLAADDVRAMFGVFTSALFVSIVVCLPEWSMYNKSPLRFQPTRPAARADATATTRE